MLSEYFSLSTRSGYNKSLDHFRVMTEVLKMIQEGYNLADVVSELESLKMIRKEQVAPILNSILVEKYGYSTISFNLSRHIRNVEDVYSIVQKWNKFDTVIAYHHPQLGITLINPANKQHWEDARDLTKEELLVVYARAAKAQYDNMEVDYLIDYKLVFEEGIKAEKPQYIDPSLVAKPSAPVQEEKPVEQPAAEPEQKTEAPVAEQAEEKEEAPAKPAGKRQVTPKYSVQVTNELFHNGNVEAWKNIIESYQSKHKGLEVYIFHDGKRVNNINSLFKWGKVKHGDVILFQVAGDNFKGISKLQRYLFEGASNRFPRFMKKDLNKPLNLF